MRSFVLANSLIVTSLATLVACSAGSDSSPTNARGVAALTTGAVVPADATRAVLDAVKILGAREGIDPEVLATAVVENVQIYGRGAVVAQLSQRVEGLEVFRSGVAVVLDRSMKPLAMTGSLARAIHPKQEASFTLDAGAAIARAVRAMTGIDARTVTASRPRDGEYTAYAVALDPTHDKVVQSARAKRVWFSGKRLQASYYVELDVASKSGVDSSLRSFVIAAASGEGQGAVLFEHDLTAHDAGTYRVWAESSGTFAPWPGPQGAQITPHPTGMVDTTVVTPLASTTVTLESAGLSTNDPWLLPTATTTVGNNVTAYADRMSPDGLGEGDLQPTATGPLTFDFLYDPTRNPNANDTNTNAVSTQLFYGINWLHDWFYDAGWDEKSKNPQADNFGRGGVGSDRIRVEAQDYAGRNNADATTPADGGMPRIQMYLFNGQGQSSLTVTAPASLAGVMSTRSAQFGPSNFDLTAAVLAVDDGEGVSPTDGCEAFVNASAIKDKIALVDRGNCPFTEKVLHAEAAGAAGVIIANNEPGGSPYLGAATGTLVKTPTLSVSQADGAKLRAELANGLTTRMKRETALDRDGGLDNAILSHEWAHVLSNRLIGNGNGLINEQGGGMGEGWSDFVALMTMLRSSDVTAAAAANWNGTYAVGGWVHGVGSGSGTYFGIRRYPYSADLGKNPLTFKHIQDGTPLPADIPLGFGEDGTQNAEVHATGEVWSSMLWQCYVHLLRDPRSDGSVLGYEEATARMRTYLVAGMKATPVSPTIMEARDALFVAMYAADQEDFRSCAAGFAERGAGIGATGPARSSQTNVGVTESFVTGNDFEVVSVTLAAPGGCDSDGILDNGESGKVTIKLRNVGTDTLPTVRAKLSSKSGKLTFGNGGAISFPSSKPFETSEATIDVSLKGAVPMSVDEIVVALDADALAVPRTVTAKLPLVVDVDNVPESAAIDKVDAPATTWVTSGNNSLDRSTQWKRVGDAVEQRWSVAGNPEISDQRLASPPLVVSEGQPFTISFRHRFSFEYGRMKAWDGGVLEISVDGDVKWTDIGEAAYNGTLSATESDNPLKGRKAFTSKSPMYPAYQTTKIDLGTAYAGQTVRVRFRVGTDEGTASVGWDVDDIAFEGISNLPFASRVANVCGAPVQGDAGVNPAGPRTDDTVKSGCGCQVPRSSTSGTTALLVAAGALLAARRRSKR